MKKQTHKNLTEPTISQLVDAGREQFEEETDERHPVLGRTQNRASQQSIALVLLEKTRLKTTKKTT